MAHSLRTTLRHLLYLPLLVVYVASVVVITVGAGVAVGVTNVLQRSGEPSPVKT